MRRILFSLIINLTVGASWASSELITPLQNETDQTLIDLLEKQVYPLQNKELDLSRLSQWIGDKRFVLLGDSTHGTEEFYQLRAEISKYLIKNKGFNNLIIEGNWPGGYRVNQFIHDQFAINEDQALSGLKQVLPWLWRNQAMVNLLQWLREFNRKGKVGQSKVNFYGMDLFSLYPSIAEVAKYLQRYHPDSAEKLKLAFDCFQSFQHSADTYAEKVNQTPELSCAEQANRLLQVINEIEISTQLQEQQDAYFNARMNAETVKVAEYYYRLEHKNQPVNTWNIRENFMLAMVNAILQYHARNNSTSKVIIWAHNSHVGDARATFMKDLNEISLGQLFRQRFSSRQVFLLGSLTYQGRVVAAEKWDRPAKCMLLPAAADSSYAELFQRVNIPRFMLNLQENNQLADLLSEKRLQRFVGVVYDPEIDNPANYASSKISQQFDAVVFIKQTHALQALDGPCY